MFFKNQLYRLDVVPAQHLPVSGSCWRSDSRLSEDNIILFQFIQTQQGNLVDGDSGIAHFQTVFIKTTATTG